MFLLEIFLEVFVNLVSLNFTEMVSEMGTEYKGLEQYQYWKICHTHFRTHNGIRNLCYLTINTLALLLNE